MSKIDMLLEQTIFLVEKEQEAFAEISARMSQLFLLLEEKIGQFKDAESKETLIAIEKHLEAHFGEMKESMQEDVAFLRQQVETMKQVSLIEDAARQEELVEIILTEAGELTSTDLFKKSITEQSQLSRNEFFVMIQEMEDAIQEGKEEELLLLMESADEEDGDEGDDCCGGNGCEDEGGDCSNSECDDEGDCDEDDDCCQNESSSDDQSAQGLTDDLVHDLARAEKLESALCKRGRPGCDGRCKCKVSCGEDA